MSPHGYHWSANALNGSSSSTVTWVVVTIANQVCAKWLSAPLEGQVNETCTFVVDDAGKKCGHSRPEKKHLVSGYDCRWRVHPRDACLFHVMLVSRSCRHCKTHLDGFWNSPHAAHVAVVRQAIAELIQLGPANFLGNQHAQLVRASELHEAFAAVASAVAMAH